MSLGKKIAFGLGIALLFGVWLAARTGAWGLKTAEDAERDALLARIEQLERARPDASPARPADDIRSLARRIDAIEARLAEMSTATVTTEAADGSEVAPRPALGPEAKAQAVREELDSALQTEPGSKAHNAAIMNVVAHLMRYAGPPPASGEIEWATRALVREASNERITPEVAAALAEVLEGFARGHAARPAIAVAIAAGWVEDPRLRTFLAGIGANTEPVLQSRMIGFLEDHPSGDFTEFFLRQVREERDVTVLRNLFDDTPVESAASTPDAAVRVMQTIEARFTDGSWDAKIRPRAAYAIAVAALRSPDFGAETLRRLAGREDDAKLAEGARKAAAEIVERTATIKGLENHFR